MMLIGSGQKLDDRRGLIGGFQDLLGDRLGLGEQVVGDGQAEQLLVGLGGLLGRLARGQLAESLQPLPFELEELAVVVVVDRLEVRARRRPG